jgi:hypothetical protein
MKVPVVLWLFNRPDLTARVFATIRAARPSRLFLIADGPRPELAEEAERCAAARAVVAAVDWPCHVERDFSDVNLGIRRRILSGLDRVFDAVPEAVILEDDTLPDPGFFPYCAELLDRYRDDDRVWMIGGYNGLGRWAGEASYFFTRTGAIWGWATWRRAWRQNDPRLERFSRTERDQRLRAHAPDPAIADHLAWRARRLQEREIDSWDMPWLLSCLIAGGWCVIPSVNLVRNIGFGARAAHSRNPDDPRDLPSRPPELPLRHPPEPGLVDARFGRWYTFMQLMSRYQELPRLEAWARAFVRHARLPLPTSDPEAAFALLPLARTADVTALLEHVHEACPDQRAVANLLGLFRRVTGSA